MYAWIWRHLPGALAAKALTALTLLLLAAALLWYIVFPWVEPKVRFDYGVVEGSTSAPPSPRP